MFKTIVVVLLFGLYCDARWLSNKDFFIIGEVKCIALDAWYYEAKISEQWRYPIEIIELMSKFESRQLFIVESDRFNLKFSMPATQQHDMIFELKYACGAYEETLRRKIPRSETENEDVFKAIEFNFTAPTMKAFFRVSDKLI